MALNHYLVGSTVVMLGTCDVIDPLTEAKTPTNPTTVTFTREQQDGTVTIYMTGAPEVVNLAPGIDACTVTVDVVGQEKWHYQGVGACAAVAEDAFDVLESIL